MIPSFQVSIVSFVLVLEFSIKIVDFVSLIGIMMGQKVLLVQTCLDILTHSSSAPPAPFLEEGFN